MPVTGMVFNVQSFSVQDGPGIRTTVFFKGCNLRCVWCHNPESWKMEPQLQFYPEKCIGCGGCFSACPTGAHSLSQDGEHLIDREKCLRCGRCAETCFAGALSLTGKKVTAEEVFRQIQRDQIYYQKSGGGVTFSGGECMIQPEFLGELLRLCKEAGIHTAVDTAGNCPWESYEKILPYADLFLYDIKAMDPKRHEELTGVTNERILSNLNRLLEAGKRVIIRIPCIPGGNWDDIPAAARFLAGKPVELVELLPYHRLGEGKNAALGQIGRRFTVPTDEDMEKLEAVFRELNVPVQFIRQTRKKG